MNQQIQEILIQQDPKSMNFHPQIHIDQIELLETQQYLIQKPLLPSSNQPHHDAEPKDQANTTHDLAQQDCLICLNPFQNPEMEAIPSCGHRFCKSCLNTHIRTNLQQCKIANCPLEDCNKPINYSSSFFKYLSPQQQKRYARMQKYLELINSDQSRMCPKQDCDGIFNIKFNPAECNTCNETYCSMCYHKFHQGNCDQNGINYLINNYKYQQCYQCKMLLQKNDGCPHMKCRCGYQFCYLCGSELVSPNHWCGTSINGQFQNILIEDNYLQPVISQYDHIIMQPKRDWSALLIASYLLVVVIIILCLPFDIIAFAITRIIKGWAEMLRRYKWYQIILGNVVLLIVCIIERGVNGIYYCNLEEVVRFFQPLSYKIIKAYQRAIMPYM